MVNHGASTACLTCKARRVKCDEGRPGCTRCANRGVTCGGYGKKPVTFRFKTQRINTGQQSQACSKDENDTGSCLVAQPREDEELTAMAFFVNGFAIGGRSLDSSRGFFESIVPIINVAGQMSTVGTATVAVAALLLDRWRRSPKTIELSRVRMGQALQRLQADLKESATRSDDATLLAILMLQCYENTRATVEWDNPQTIHQDGALTLVKSLGLRSFSSVYGMRLLLYILNADINAALREERSVDANLRNWAQHTADLPLNMSSRLDLIAIRLAQIQEDFARSQLAGVTVDQALLTKLTEVETAFKLWIDTVPRIWHPVRFLAQTQPVPPVDMYAATCEIYPSIEIASIWNTWRNYSLITLGLRLQMERSLDRPDRGLEQKVHSDHSQALVDSICFSIPFCLGNRSKPNAMEHASANSPIFPSYHTLKLFGIDVRSLHPTAAFMTAEDSRSNAQTQGAWQLSSILRLLVFTLSKPSSFGLRTALRDGQLLWIERQLMRISQLFGISEARSPVTLGLTR